MPYPSLYRARAVSIRSGVIDVYVPQVFGETTVTISDALGLLPTQPTMGWVFFQAGNPEFPVWASGLSEGDPGQMPDYSEEIAALQAEDVLLDSRLDVLEAGGGGTNEVWIGSADPIASNPTIELWYDTDAQAPLIDELRWYTAWGVVAEAVADGIVELTTTPVVAASVTVQLIAGRRYRAVHLFRTAEAPSLGPVVVKLIGSPATGLHDHYQLTAPPNTSGYGGGATLEWRFDGNGAVATLEVQAYVLAGTGRLHQQAGSATRFYIEDIGPVSGVAPIASPIPAWIAPTFQNGWHNRAASYQAVRYRKVGDDVQIEGSMEGGTMSASAFTLPPGYRPVAEVHFPLVGFRTSGTDVAGPEIMITTAGTAVPSGAINAFLHLGRIQFSVTP